MGPLLSQGDSGIVVPLSFTSNALVVQGRWHWADIGRTRPYQPAAALLLAGMCGPARSTGDRENRRKSLPRDLQGVEQDRGEELHIGVERPVRVFPPQRRTDIGLDLACKRQVGAAAGEPLDRALEHIGARIADAVDAVAKTHQPFAARQRAVDPWLDAFAGADGVDHFQHWLGGSAVKRS